jgi:hypothetical protein
MKLYLTLAALCAATLTTTFLGQAQTPLIGTPPRLNAEIPAPHKTVLKLGMGLGRGFDDGINSSLTIPTTFGVERLLTNKFFAYGNLTAAFRLTNRRIDYYRLLLPLVPRSIIAVGGRYYYNQEGRIRNHLAAGPFIGNYLALQVSTDLVPYRTHDAHAYVAYDYSAISALWGMQRHLSRRLIYDLNRESVSAIIK